MEFIWTKLQEAYNQNYRDIPKGEVKIAKDGVTLTLKHDLRRTEAVIEPFEGFTAGGAKAVGRCRLELSTGLGKQRKTMEMDHNAAGTCKFISLLFAGFIADHIDAEEIKEDLKKFWDGEIR